MIARTLGAAALLFAFGSTASAATLVVRASGIRSAEGRVYAGICATSFEESTCAFGDRVPARVGAVELRFPNVPPGRYAVAVYHDVNGNGRLDRSAIGFPSEPYGFSNDVGRTSFPSFTGALVAVGDPATTVSVPVR